MPYVYANVDDLEGTEKVGSKQCVVLLQTYAGLPSTAQWREGKNVLDATGLSKGTAIATFVDGKYQSRVMGNHAAFLVAKDAAGIWVMDQWSSDEKKPLVSKRYLRRKGQWKNGQYVDPSNNADAYFVIE